MSRYIDHGTALTHSSSDQQCLIRLYSNGFDSKYVETTFFCNVASDEHYSSNALLFEKLFYFVYVCRTKERSTS